MVIPRILVREETVWNLEMISISSQYFKVAGPLNRSYKRTHTVFVPCKYASERTLLKRLFRTDIGNSGTHETLSSNESTQTLRNITEWSFYCAGCHKTQLGIKMAVPACEVLLKWTKRSSIIPSTQSLQLWPCSNEYSLGTI